MASESHDLEHRCDELRGDRDRFREGAHLALDDLEWVIGYLDRNRRAGLADRLRRNRRIILERLRTS